MIPTLLGALARRPNDPPDAGETRWAASDGLPEAANAGSPAEAIRLRLQFNRADLSRAGPMITLLDPTQAWPRMVAHLLAPAAGETPNTVDLRNLVGLLPGTRIERVAVTLPGAQRVKIYATESRHVAQRQAIAEALAERSHLALVPMGLLAPGTLASALEWLLAATRAPGWVCPRLAFVLAPGAAGQRAVIEAQPWPQALQVQVIDLPVGPLPRALWQAVQQAWTAPQAETVRAPGLSPLANPAVAAAPPPVLGPAAVASDGEWPDSLQAMATIDGVRGVALVDIEFGHVLGTAGAAMGGGLETAASALAAAAGLLNWRLSAGRAEEMLVRRSGELLMLVPSQLRPRQGFALMLAPEADLAFVRRALRVLDREPVLAAIAPA